MDDIDDALRRNREDRDKLRAEMHKLESRGEELTMKERADHGVLEKKLKELNRRITKLKKQKGTGRRTRRR
jgi:DNA repair exonuclease SbcCD ATPase subunit